VKLTLGFPVRLVVVMPAPAISLRSVAFSPEESAKESTERKLFLGIRILRRPRPTVMVMVEAPIPAPPVVTMVEAVTKMKSAEREFALIRGFVLAVQMVVWRLRRR
jgi:hypothetical protein